MTNYQRFKNHQAKFRAFHLQINQSAYYQIRSLIYGTETWHSC